MKENRTLEFLLSPKNNKKADRLCMEFPWNSNTKCTKVPQPCISMHPFSDVPFFSKISQPHVTTNKMINSVVYHLCSSQDYPQGYILSYFFKLLRALPLSRILVEFSLTCIFHHVWKKKLIYCVHILRKCTDSPLKTPGRKCFENLFPSTAERGGENYDLLYQKSIGKYEDDLEH